MDTRMQTDAVLVRAVTYATLFIGFLLVFIPTRLLAAAGIDRPPSLGAPETAGMLLTAGGAALALWCVFTFVFVGRGTPGPFDPPRRLVVRGPYRVVRNPMYVGAGLALAGAALVFRSGALATYAVAFMIVMNAFVHLYEEPALRRTFGDDYGAYCQQVPRWLPGRRRRA
jgi:protein-S-isoprenylcysteine O-methyltransferase Ste14